MEISNDIIFRSPENGDYILLDCSTSNVTKNGLYQKLPDGRTALKVKINGLDALYVLPIASADTLGGIRVGSGLSIDPTTGILSATGGGTGTVTSVSSGNLTPLFTVSVANPTTTPSFAFTQVAQAANLVFASPNGSSGNPTFRALVAGDIPSLSYVSSVGATLPLTSSGGLAPNISTSMATNKLIGRYSAGSGVMQEVSIGSGLTLTGAGLLNNTATPTPLGYYGAFSDYTNQTASAINTGYPFTFNTTDLTNQVSVVSSSRITIDNTGIYNLQFSAQFVNTDTQEHDVTIWLRKNGTDIVGSSGYVAVVAKHGGIDGHVLPSWNYLLSVVAGDYFEIVWSTTSLNVSVATYAAGSPPPSTASIIATVTQQSGIMAGTGITAINSLTGASQTLTTGLTGTDFGITSSGSTHTFNLPIASATNTGKLSNTDWSTFNDKQAALGYTPLNPANNLSDVSNVSTARSNLGLDYTLPILAETSADGAVSSGTTNTYSQGVLITPNMINVDTSIEVLAGFKKTTTFGNTTIRIYVNTTNDLTGSPILVGQYTAINTTMVQVMQRFLRIKVKNGTGAGTEVQATSLLTAQNDYVGTGVAVSNLAIDWTSNKYVIAAMQMSSASDSGRVTFLKVRR